MTNPRRVLVSARITLRLENEPTAVQIEVAVVSVDAVATAHFQMANSTLSRHSRMVMDPSSLMGMLFDRVQIPTVPRLHKHHSAVSTPKHPREVVGAVLDHNPFLTMLCTVASHLVLALHKWHHCRRLAHTSFSLCSQ